MAEYPSQNRTREVLVLASPSTISSQQYPNVLLPKASSSGQVWKADLRDDLNALCVRPQQLPDVDQVQALAHKTGGDEVDLVGDAPVHDIVLVLGNTATGNQLRRYVGTEVIAENLMSNGRKHRQRNGSPWHYEQFILDSYEEKCPCGQP